MQQFATLNSQAARTGLNPGEFAWIENFMPIGDANAAAVPAPGGAIALLDGSSRTLVSAFIGAEVWSGNPATVAISTTTIDVHTLKLWHFDSDLVSTDGTSTFGLAGTLDLTISRFGAGSMKSDANIARMPDVSFFDPVRTGDWTWESWARLDTGKDWALHVATNRLVISFDDSANNAAMLVSNGTTFFVNLTGISVSIAPATWYHWAATHDAAGDRFDFFFNGNRIGTVSSADDMASVGGNLDVNASSFQTCWTDEMRVSDSVRYSGTTYSIPSSPFDG